VARIALVACFLSAVSLGTTAHWKMKVAEVEELYRSYSARPSFTNDPMMDGIHATNMAQLEARRAAAEGVYAQISRWTFWGHGAAIVIAVSLWIGMGFRKPPHREQGSSHG
jgi:hypothetical protein